MPYSGALSDCVSFFRLDQVCMEDWSAEENLVHSTVTTDQSTYLTHQDIQEFTKACAQCNCEKVIDFLVRAMEDTDQKVVMVRVQQLQMLFIVMSSTSPSPKKAGRYKWFIVLHLNLCLTDWL